MVRISSLFVVIALAAIFGADISVSTHDPFLELKRISIGAITPNFFSLPGFARSLFNTISFALIGICGAIILGSSLSFFFDYTPVRLFCAFIRAIHELFWVFLLMPITGLNSLCGILAIAIPYSGIFAKVYAEIRQECNQDPIKSLPPGTSRVIAFCYGTLPLIYKDIKNYTSYRFECALRSSAILGFIGLPTLGYHLETAFREGMYSEAAALLYLFYLLILSLKFWTKPQYLLMPLLAAIIFTSWENSISWTNIHRFFFYDILPWPMRAGGFYEGTSAVVLVPLETLNWFWQTLVEKAMPGIWNTLVLTQIALVATALFTLVIFPPASRVFYQPSVTRPANVLLVVLRTTPEFILAYIFLQLWGPSMLPAIFALFIHNGAILGHLTSKNIEAMQFSIDKTSSRINLYFYEVLPRCYGQFLAFLFYRWEVIMRESAILGILGIATLGFYIDDAIAMDHLDTAIVLIVITALLNMAIDTLSQIIRRSLKISVSVNSRSSP